ncbi:MAG: helicase-related protein [Desulfobacter sp.]
MSTRFFTNAGENTLLKKFKGIFEHNRDIEFFDALVGFLRASGYFSIRPFLHHVPNVRILVGINVDTIISDYHKQGLLFHPDSDRAVEEFRKALRDDIQEARYTKEVEEGIVQFVDDVVAKKLEIRAHPSKRLHAKIYIFRPSGFNEHKAGAVITGSSNLTDAGLGTKEIQRNYEFNVLLNSFEDVQFATNEFEALWEEGISILPKDVSAVREHSYLRSDLTPFEIYIKFLTEYFGSAVEFDPNAITDLPQGFMRLSYQVDAVKLGYDLLHKHNGFFLADVVGLGKTIIATLIAKKFFFHNDFPSYLSRTLIIVPPALKESWQHAIDKFELKTAEIVTNGSLHKIKHAEKYDLIIVDEAHKFRNDTAEIYDQLQRICKAPTKHRLTDGTLAKKKVILVSATPLNNRPADIRNLIFLFQDGKDSTLEIGNLQRFFANRIKEYETALRNPDTAAAREEVKRIYELIRTKVFSYLTIRRTRTDLMEHETYSNDLAEQNIVFPKVEKPKKILYQLDQDMELLYDQTINALKKDLTYNRYRAIGFLKPEKKRKYQNADRISAQLANIMKTLLVKRLDSSFHAFTESLLRFKNATSAMQSMFENGTIYIAPNLNVSSYILEGREDELIALIAEKQANDPTIEICTPEDFEDGYLAGLQADYETLDSLSKQWVKVKNDPKFDEFLAYLKTELFDRKHNHGGKLVIFSEAKETTDILKRQLENNGYTKVLCIDSENRNERMPTVRANFDANIPLDQQANDYNILISTEVLAEGVNLHRSNVIVNYDTPWNSTRLMQRIGRVNRIGTTASKIHVYNFFPTAKVDNDIDLHKKALMKLQAFHSALGEDSQIYSEDEEFGTFGLFDRDVEEERDERLVFLMELRKFKADNPEKFRRIRNLPLRARTGRSQSDLDGKTVTFIRNQKRDAFYRIGLDDEIEELSFVETARIYQATVDEASHPLHDRHHDHVNLALDDFAGKLQAEAIQHKVVDTAQGPNERKALSYLDGFLKLPFISEAEKRRIRGAKHAIKLARFAQLQRGINDLAKSQKKTPVTAVALLEKLMEILNRYPLGPEFEETEQPVIAVKTSGELRPEIIISESFSS